MSINDRKKLAKALRDEAAYLAAHVPHMDDVDLALIGLAVTQLRRLHEESKCERSARGWAA